MDYQDVGRFNTLSAKSSSLIQHYQVIIQRDVIRYGVSGAQKVATTGEARF